MDADSTPAFLRPRRTGVGIAALASLLRGTRRTAAGLPHFRAEGQARHLPVPVRRAVADGSVRLQAGAGEAARHGTAGFDPQGPAADRHDGDQTSVPDRAVDLQVRAARQERRVAQRAAAAHGEDRRRHLRSSSRCTPKRSITIRRSRSSRPASNSPGGRASGPGSPTGSAARIRICRRSW